jgi:ribosomal protein S15P/S13E
MAKTTRKRNPQDATRARDVAPLRRRIEKLETHVKALKKQFAQLVRLVG